MQVPHPAGISRFLVAAFAAFALCVMPAMAAPSTVAKLGSKVFGDGVPLKATSKGSVTVSPQYTYLLNGTCQGTEDMAKIVPKGQTFAVFLDSFSKGISAGLTGVVPPPVAPSKSSIIQLPVKGARTVKGLGKVSLSAILRCEVQPNGKVIFEIKNVSIRNAAGPVKGAIRLLAGSSFTVTAPPRVVFKTSGVAVDEDASVVNVVLSRSNFLRSKVTVTYSTADAKAKAGIDYVAVTNGTVDFPPNAKEVTIPITILNNPAASSDRVFRINLTGISSDPAGAFLGDRRMTSVNIVNKP